MSLDDVANNGASGETDNVRGDVETVEGGTGDDRLVGSAGDNNLYGGAGNDFVDGGLGADRLDGGEGLNTVSYRDRTAAVVVTVSYVGGDGEAGEGDFG